jgi:hypothetical protein
MANAGPNMNGSRFHRHDRRGAPLDGKHTVRQGHRRHDGRLDRETDTDANDKPREPAIERVVSPLTLLPRGRRRYQWTSPTRR